MRFHHGWRPAVFSAAQSLFALCLFIPVFIYPRSPQSSSYLFWGSVKATHWCSSPVSPLLQVPISPFDSHSVISPVAAARLSSAPTHHFWWWSCKRLLGCDLCFCLAGFDEAEQIMPVNSERDSPLWHSALAQRAFCNSRALANSNAYNFFSL